MLGKIKIIPINQSEFFCETEQVFVTGGFSEIKDKFKDNLFEATCSPTNFEKKEGDCKYVTRFNACEEIKGLQVSQIINEKLPLPEDPIIVTEKNQQQRLLLLKKMIIYLGRSILHHIMMNHQTHSH
ncbi:hypothetical protein ACRQPS_005199 [Klebsiella pneumoniae]|uniref:hypothetical protein n=1 Tax=Klebsiella pneumoniae TaxID=573 RepID=UPI0011E4DD51|nr:hypothetical protein [Klebsiella pneumoniae]EKI2325272.1 hypothetical protein [Klebsiella pneumoniae]EKZ6825636.1 hypothetical protein [Klebsiella pneumoniae]MBD7142895.1 hypothetical protein [Klebsiella pneumoniae]